MFSCQLEPSCIVTINVPRIWQIFFFNIRLNTYHDLLRKKLMDRFLYIELTRDVSSLFLFFFYQTIRNYTIDSHFKITKSNRFPFKRPFSFLFTFLSFSLPFSLAPSLLPSHPPFFSLSFFFRLENPESVLKYRFLFPVIISWFHFYIYTYIYIFYIFYKKKKWISSVDTLYRNA